MEEEEWGSSAVFCLFVWRGFLNFGHFFCDNHRVTLADLLGSQSLIIKCTLMLVRVTVYGTEQASAAASETCEANLLLTRKTSVLLFLSLLVSVIARVTATDGGAFILLKCWNSGASSLKASSSCGS